MRCPICKKAITPADEQKYAPFCSERCKLVDLGRWLDGRYQIPVVEDETEDLDYEIAPNPKDEED